MLRSHAARRMPKFSPATASSLPQVLSRDVSHQSAHIPEVRQEPEQQERLTGRALVEQHIRRWNPLNEALPAHEASQFAWQRGERHHPDLQTHADRPGPPHQRQNRQVPTTRTSTQPRAKKALDFAMPQGQEHSHSKDITPQSSCTRNQHQQRIWPRLWYRNVTFELTKCATEKLVIERLV